MWPYLSFSGYKSQYTIESLNDKNERQEIKESEIMKDAIIQLLKITVFIVRKHWAHTASYEDLVCFIGNDLGNSVLKEYLTLTDSHKNATYITANTVKQFIKIISEWMNTVNELKTCKKFTLLLDESIDEANCSELLLILCMIKDGKNHFLDLLQLNRGDAETIFESVSDCLRENELDIKGTRFAGMDGCSTMAGEHSGLKQLLAAATYHFVYIHCWNHRLALYFAHLIPKFPDFENFNRLLLNLYLLMKNSSAKQSIFKEIQIYPLWNWSKQLWLVGSATVNQVNEF